MKADIRCRQLFIYLDEAGYYRPVKELDFRVWLNSYVTGSEYAPRINTSTVRELFNQLLTAPDIQMTFDGMDPEQSFVNTLNGVFDVRTGKMFSHSSKYLFTNTLSGNYVGVKKPEPAQYLRWLWSLASEDQDSFDLLVASISYMLSNYHTAKKFFYLFGKQHSGKSRLLRLIDMLVGEYTASHIALEDMSDPHVACEFYGKKINTCAEREPGKILRRTKIIKELSGGDMIDANPKGLPHFTFK